MRALQALSQRTRRKRSVYSQDAPSLAAYQVGKFSYGVPAVRSWGEEATLSIGKFCSFADGIEIFLGGNHRTDWVSTYPFSHMPEFPEASRIKGHPATRGDVVIGNDVWIGSGALILSGVTIADGAVIGARAVVSRNVPPYAIVAGNPAQMRRTRFSDDQIAHLLAIRWWDWEEEKIRKMLPLIMSEDIEQFLSAAGLPAPQEEAARA